MLTTHNAFIQSQAGEPSAGDGTSNVFPIYKKNILSSRETEQRKATRRSSTIDQPRTEAKTEAARRSAENDVSLENDNERFRQNGSIVAHGRSWLKTFFFVRTSGCVKFIHASIFDFATPLAIIGNQSPGIIIS